MKPICVVLHSQSNGLFWDAVIQSLENEPGIELCQISNTDKLFQFLQEAKPQILIVEHNAVFPFSSCDYERYSQINPRLAVIAIDDSGLDAFIGLKDLGHELLVTLVRAISSDRPSDNNGRKLTLLKGRDVLKLIPKSNIIADKPRGVDHTQSHLHIVQTWLDICFHQYLIEKPMGDGNSINIPGWTMSTERARAILGGEYLSADASQLEKACQYIEEKLTKYDVADLSALSSRLSDIHCAFSLDDFEKKILYFALAPELDGRYARIFGFLNDDFTRCRPGPTILSKLIPNNTQSAWELRLSINTGSSLARFGLLIEDANDIHPASDVGFKVAPELIDYLMVASEESEQSSHTCFHLKKAIYNAGAKCNANAKDSVIVSASMIDPNDADTKKAESLLAQWKLQLAQVQSLPIIQLAGSSLTLNWFYQLCDELNQTVVVFNADALPGFDSQTVWESLIGATRLAKLHQALVLITGTQALSLIEQKNIEHSLIFLSKQLRSRIVIHLDRFRIFSDRVNVWYLERSKISSTQLKKLWRDCTLSFGIKLKKKDISLLANALRFDAYEINALLSKVTCDHAGTPITDTKRNDATSIETKNTSIASIGTANINATAIIEAAKPFRNQWRPSSVREVEALFIWDDIVLPDSVMGILREIPGHVRDSTIVLDEWGYRSKMPYGLGITALFSGPSGTGKTMAAQVIASALGVALFQVDLAKTISKYIGETEKNLDVVFDAAEQAGAVLLFDEADALFGKRTEVRDAHDRYANVEVAYLLQRMETYSGLAILTTNIRQNLDKAFMRRLRFVVEFCVPTAAEREAIWQASFPSDAPLGDDINFKFLARRLELTGGNIQQIAIRSAFSAAAQGEMILMRHVVQATCDELHKLGMNNAEKSLAEFIPTTRCASYE